MVPTFRTGDGITAGQTKVKHKAVDLGTVKGVSLSEDLQHVDVTVDMTATAARTLTEKARFWVVRPRFTPGNVSGIETLLSGSYIEMDPGATPGGTPQRHYTGLEEPPAIRSGEPGTTFVLKADRIGALGIGSPVFYRDVQAGEVLSSDFDPNGTGATIQVFVRAPFDKFVHPSSRFWNASGLSVNLGAQGLQVKVASLQAVLSGGVAFDTLGDNADQRGSPANARFDLYHDESAARAAGFNTQIKLLVYFDGSVRGLAPGAPVEINGIQIGTVTDVHLLFDLEGASSRVAVHMEVQPQRFLPPDKIHPEDGMRIAQGLVKRGLRAQLASSNLITGQMLVSFEFVADAPAAEAHQEGDEIVLPSSGGGGLDSLTSSLTNIAHKLEALPLEQVVRNLSDTLHGTSALLNGPELRQTLASIDATTRRLPEVAQRLDATLGHADHLLDSATSGYGLDLQFNRDLSRVLAQINDTARSVRLLADYLSLHPEALIRGRTGQATER